jgi:hypothetical protein
MVNEDQKQEAFARLFEKISTLIHNCPKEEQDAAISALFHLILEIWKFNEMPPEILEKELAASIKVFFKEK